MAAEVWQDIRQVQLEGKEPAIARGWDEQMEEADVEMELEEGEVVEDAERKGKRMGRRRGGGKFGGLNDRTGEDAVRTNKVEGTCKGKQGNLDTQPVTKKELAAFQGSIMMRFATILTQAMGRPVPGGQTVQGQRGQEAPTPQSYVAAVGRGKTALPATQT